LGADDSRRRSTWSRSFSRGSVLGELISAGQRPGSVLLEMKQRDG